MLNYNYYAGTNQLSYVQDQAPAINYADDIDDQGGNNYFYDNIGNLVTDVAEQLDNIFWNNYGKIDSIYSSGKQMAMKFRYDPSGNRIEKRFYNLDSYNDVLRVRATHYVRDASGNTMAVYDYSDNDTLILKEFDIYGSSRLGLLHESDTIAGTGVTTDTIPDAWLTFLGDKEYEQTNHLGNVMSTITDKPVPIDTTSDLVADYYDPEFVTANDYYPFGMLEPGRNFNSSEYRFGFDGQEKVDEISGEGNHNTALFWEYDTRLGRRWNPDPIVKYNEGSYNAFSNNPIWLVDPLGDDTLVFGENNKFSKTIKAEGDPTGKKEGKDGFTFTFADPVHDPKDIGNDPGQIGELFIVSDQSITKDLDRAGVNEEENKGPVDGPWFLLNHSNYGKNDGKTDFYNTSKILGKDGLDEGKLYITKVDDKTVAHNAHNFGNFLWGAAANSVEVSLKLSLWGANFNNYLNAKENANKKWSEKTGDSKDDKYSISLGWQWRQNKRTK